jgi:hypothetical protein
MANILVQQKLQRLLLKHEELHIFRNLDKNLLSFSLFYCILFFQVYCKNMRRLKPEEYIVLPAGGRDNYAEIYDMR